MLTCKQLPVFLVDWQLFEEPPKCKYRCRCECRNPRRHKDTDPCPMDKIKWDRTTTQKPKAAA